MNVSRAISRNVVACCHLSGSEFINIHLAEPDLKWWAGSCDDGKQQTYRRCYRCFVGHGLCPLQRLEDTPQTVAHCLRKS